MKKSFMDGRKEEEREAFLKRSPVERIRIMHDLFLEIVSIKARGEKVSEYEIYRRYLKDNPRHYERTSR